MHFFNISEEKGRNDIKRDQEGLHSGMSASGTSAFVLPGHNAPMQACRSRQFSIQDGLDQLLLRGRFKEARTHETASTSAELRGPHEECDRCHHAHRTAYDTLVHPCSGVKPYGEDLLGEYETSATAPSRDAKLRYVELCTAVGAVSEAEKL